MTRTRPWRVIRYRIAVLRRPIGLYSVKFYGDGTHAPERPPWSIILISWVGALVSLGALGWLAEESHAPLVMAPFGASVVLLYAHPDSVITQPRNVIGGHILGGVIGILTGMALGDAWLAMALAVATTVAAMKATRSVHPPAGATAIVCMQSHAGWAFLCAPVLTGSVLLVIAAAVYNNAVEHRRYPKHWW
jgi:CBS-domain-containing membrane protein